MNKLSKVALILSVGLLLFAGCSQPPNKEIKRAKDAVANCELEGRIDEMYTAAQGYLAAANADKLEQDMKFALFRSYGRAKENYMKAIDAANQASRPTYPMPQNSYPSSTPSTNNSVEARLSVIETKLEMIILLLKSEGR